MMPIYCAALQGYTDAMFRRLHHAMWGGVEEYYTPFVRVEKGAFRRKDVADIGAEANAGVPVVPQMLPRDAEELGRLANLFAENGYRRADINLSCPFPPVALHHRGAGLLPHVQEVEQLLAATRQYPDMVFSVKLRLGWERPDECMRLSEVLNACELHHVTLHPRTGRMAYRGTASTEAFAAFAERCRHPLVYNGDVLSLEDLTRLSTAFPSLAGIMVGRGLLATPQLAQVWREGGTRLFTPAILDRLQQFHEAIFGHLQSTSQGEAQLMTRLHALWEYFLTAAPRRARKAVAKARDVGRYRAAVSALFEAWREELAAGKDLCENLCSGRQQQA